LRNRIEFGENLLKLILVGTLSCPRTLPPRLSLLDARIFCGPIIGIRSGVYCACQTLRVAGQRRRRRWLWWIPLGVAIVVVVGTVFSFGYNAVTRKPMAVPAALSYVRTGDLRTRFRQWGSSGTPIVLVHGFVESADTWQYIAPRLATAGHRVYALDLDGWGYSQRVAPFTAEHQTTQLLDFIAALHLHRPVLVGHSSGAAIVAMAALRRPSAVGGVMFLDGDALNTGAGARSPLRHGAGARSPLIHVLIDQYRTTIFRLLLRSDAFVRRIYGSTCGDSCPPLDAHSIDQWRRPLQVAGAEAALWAMANQGVPGLPPATLAGLATTDLPKAVVFGADDSVFDKSSPQTTAARIGAPPPMLIPGARHLTPVNSPAAVAAAVLALTRRVRPA
jgi:pimeloyl-ACP methyl ester carboxylesterase